jgi:acyl-CoA reductase-like NAD-dependent aldehyde dehydrogenase
VIRLNQTGQSNYPETPMSVDGKHTTTLLIGGEQVAGTGAPLAIENPYTTETIVEMPSASAEQVEAAVAAARGAWPAWARTTAGERCELLHEVARRLREGAEGLARTMTEEGGKPLIENRDELEWTAAAFDYYAEIGRDHAGRVIPPIESTQLAMVVKDPLGVVGCIVPWNYPLLLLAWKVAPALAAGNCVVCKPSELTPLSTLMLAEPFDHMPAGVVNLLAGAGDIGAAIASHPGVDCIAFTGSVATGKKVAAACTERLARMNLEMGGKDAFIVCADVAAELEVAARGGAWAAFLNAGQVCTSAERFYVAEEVFDDYVSAFVEHTRSLVLGDPFEVSTDLGPMVSDPQRSKVLAQLDAARSAGAEILIGGDSGGIEPGHFLSPAVVVGAAPDSALLREETFGPVAPIVPVGSLEEAIELANGTEFGLGANVYTGDLENAVRCMRELRAGTVWINDPLTDNDAGPFGGFKQSGLGRELGREGLEAFQETKHVHMESRIERKEWWYPYKEYGAES